MKRSIGVSITLSAGLFLAIIAPNAPALAQSTPPPVFNPPPSQTPIDGGLGLFAVAGAAHAIRRLRHRAAHPSREDAPE